VKKSFLIFFSFFTAGFLFASGDDSKADLSIQDYGKHVSQFEYLFSRCAGKGYSNMRDEACSLLRKFLGSNPTKRPSATADAQAAWTVAFEYAQSCEASSFESAACRQAQKTFLDFIQKAEIVSAVRSRCPLPKLEGHLSAWTSSAENECHYVEMLLREQFSKK